MPWGRALSIAGPPSITGPPSWSYFIFSFPFPTPNPKQLHNQAAPTPQKRLRSTQHPLPRSPSRTHTLPYRTSSYTSDTTAPFQG